MVRFGRAALPESPGGQLRTLHYTRGEDTRQPKRETEDARAQTENPQPSVPQLRASLPILLRILCGATRGADIGRCAASGNQAIQEQQHNRAQHGEPEARLYQRILRVLVDAVGTKHVLQCHYAEQVMSVGTTHDGKQVEPIAPQALQS